MDEIMSFVDSSGALLCVLLYIFLSFVSITLSPSEETKPQSQFSSPSVRIIDSSDSKDAMASEDVERLVLKCEQLVMECELLSRRCEDASIITAEWAETAGCLEEQRVELEEKLEEAKGIAYMWQKANEERVALEEKMANGIAEMWQKETELKVTLIEEKKKVESIALKRQKEAGLFEEELAGQIKMLKAAQEIMQGLEERVSQSDIAIAEKDSRILELNVALSIANKRHRREMDKKGGDGEKFIVPDLQEDIAALFRWND